MTAPEDPVSVSLADLFGIMPKFLKEKYTENTLH